MDKKPRDFADIICRPSPVHEYLKWQVADANALRSGGPKVSFKEWMKRVEEKYEAQGKEQEPEDG